MRTKAINQLADVICRAQGQARTPAGIAFAIESAGLLQSPETAAELVALRARVAELETGVEESRPVDEDPIAYELTPAALVEDPRPALVKLKAPETTARLRWLLGGGPRG